LKATAMPRIIDSEDSLHDFCIKHWPNDKVAYNRFACGGDMRLYCYDAAHPNYQDKNYTCELCHAPLTNIDN
jgi:hypothetical protein